MCQVLYLINLQTPENYYQKETEREERVGNLPKGTRLEGTQLGSEQGLSSSARRAQGGQRTDSRFCLREWE